MQHKVVCKLLLKVVCGSSALLIVLLQVSQSFRLTSTLVNNFIKESSIFCTASNSFVSILESVQDTHVNALAMAGDLKNGRVDQSITASAAHRTVLEVE